MDDNQDLVRRANEEIYKKNFELSIRIQTLNALKALYATSIRSRGLQEMGQLLIDVIVEKLKISAALLHIVSKDGKTLYPLAVTKNDLTSQSLSLIGKPLNLLSLSTGDPNNFIVSALKTETRQTTDNLLNIFTPYADQKLSEQIRDITHIKSIIIYPLLLEEKQVGVLTIGLSKDESDLSIAEKETLDQVIDVVAVAIDRAQLHEELVEANKHLTELDKMKDEFLSLASHELRTPMTAIKGYVWMVQNGKAGPITDTTKNYLDIVYKSTERLIHLVNDMLDISRIESGKTQLHPELTHISDLFNQVKAEFTAQAITKNMSLAISPLPELPQINIDKDKITQVLENLVGNSLKYTPEGGKVTISAACVSNNIEISVSDTGKGMAPEDLPRLFTKFSRLGGDNLTTYSQPGTGLGLYLSKQYVEMHHGQIWATSELGKGSTFTFSLPIDKITTN